ncbi:hypothetical protein ACS0TY_002532 [Phlomoides rotata]
MGSLYLQELGLDCRFPSKVCVQKPIGRLLPDLSKINCDFEKISKLDDYVNQLRDEMKKIEGLKRELPLCMLLLRDEISAADFARSSLKPVPVLEEFIPLKKICTEEKDEGSKGKGEDNSSKDKMNWMSSVQLWNPDINPNSPNAEPSLELEDNKKGKGEELNRPVMDNLFQSEKNREVERAFVPSKGCSKFPVMAVGKEYMDEPPVSGLSLCTPGIKQVGFSLNSSYSRPGLSSATHVQSNFKAGQQQTGRKQRRSWSAQLHHKFTDALEHLGGPLVATPKQIREHMQVNGLTNDEVKSHLQKYRAHIKRVKSNSNSQAAVFWSSGGDFLKHRNSKSNSPDGPLQLSEGNGVDDEDDEISESSSSRSHIINK